MLVLFSLQRLHVLWVSLNANWASFEIPKNAYLKISYLKKCLSYNFHIWKNACLTISIYCKVLILQFPYMKKCLFYNFHYEKMFILQFLYMKKCLSYNFHIWKKSYPRVFFFNFLSLWSCRKLKDMHFFINGNCRTSIFGQPTLRCSWNTIYNWNMSFFFVHPWCVFLCGTFFLIFQDIVWLGKSSLWFYCYSIHQV